MSRVQHLSKKERDYISTKAAEVFCWNVNEPCKYVEETLTRFRKGRESVGSRPNRADYAYKSIEDLAAGEFDSLSNKLSQRAIIDRLLSGSPMDLVNGLQLAGRFGFVSDLAKTPEYSGGYDCLHVYEILSALAVKHTAVVSAYLARHPSPARKGHPYSVLLCNAVRAILRREIGTFGELCSRIEKRSDGVYDKAMLDCLQAIMQGDPVAVAESLKVILKGHRRKTVHDGMKKYFCVPAHALRNMSADVLGESSPVVDEAIRQHPLWDQDVDLIATALPGPLARLQNLANDHSSLFALIRDLPPNAPNNVFAEL